MKIKDLPKIDRPREKLEKYGPERLSDSELLAILLRTGSEGINVVELAGKILGIEVTDHIIVAENRFLSFKEQGLI